MHRLFKSVQLVVALASLALPIPCLCTLTSLAKNDPYPMFNSLDPQSFLYTRPCQDTEDPYCIHAENLKWSISCSPFGQNAYSGANKHGEKFLPARVCPNTEPCGSTMPVPITGNRVELGDLTGRINMIALLYGEKPENQDLPDSLKDAQDCLFSQDPEFQPTPFNGANNTQNDFLAQNDDTHFFNTSSDNFEISNNNAFIPNNFENLNNNAFVANNFEDANNNAIAQNFLFRKKPPLCQLPEASKQRLDDPSLIDPAERYASLTFPLKYHKRGVRLDFSSNINCGFGINVQAGIASISQLVKRIRLQTKVVPGDAKEINIENDLTCQADTLCDFQLPPDETGVTTFTGQVKHMLTGNLTQIADQLHVDIDDFNDTSVEELRVNAFWRHTFDINLDNDGPKATCMPYVMLSGSVSPGKKRCPNKLFSLPFGNDGHNAIGFSAGLNFDFINTIELSGEVGVTHFFSRTVDKLRIPNSIYQKTLFPFVADAKVSPGNNWHFAGKIASYHFLGNLSTYFQFVMIDHSHDSICLKNKNNMTKKNIDDEDGDSSETFKSEKIFVPKTLEKTTGWKSKLANVGFTYDISPAISLGFLWQAPLSQKNTYRSSTIMCSFNASF